MPFYFQQSVDRDPKECSSYCFGYANFAFGVFLFHIETLIQGGREREGKILTSCARFLFSKITFAISRNDDVIILSLEINDVKEDGFGSWMAYVYNQGYQDDTTVTLQAKSNVRGGTANSLLKKIKMGY